MSDTIRIFVGTAANNEDLESMLVLEYTLRKYASQPIEIEWMMLSRDPDSFWYGWNNMQWSTPFSGFRFAIPERCNFEGKAIYMDSDMIVRADIAELWNEQLEGNNVAVMRDPLRSCVTLFDCARAKEIAFPVDRLRSDPGAYRVQRVPFGKRSQTFKTGMWNYIDTDDNPNTINDPRVKCVHYTSIATQPQLRYAIPRCKKEGIDHWYKGTPTPHWRGEIPALFDIMLQEASNGELTVDDDGALADPYGILDKYRVEPFGSYGLGSKGGGLLKAKSAKDIQHMIKK